MIQITEKSIGNIYGFIAKVRMSETFESDLSEEPIGDYDNELVRCVETAVFGSCLIIEEQPDIHIPYYHFRETTEAEKEQYRTQFVHHNID